MRNPPLDVVLSWPPANFVNPITRPHSLLGIEIFMMLLAIAAVALRFYVRLIIMKKPWWDDWLCLAALVRVPRAFRLRRCGKQRADGWQ